MRTMSIRWLAQNGFLPGHANGIQTVFLFHMDFAVAIAECRAVSDVARFANAAAALKCTRLGGRVGAPSRREVDALLTDSGET